MGLDFRRMREHRVPLPPRGSAPCASPALALQVRNATFLASKIIGGQVLSIRPRHRAACRSFCRPHWLHTRFYNTKAKKRRRESQFDLAPWRHLQRCGGSNSLYSRRQLRSVSPSVDKTTRQFCRHAHKIRFRVESSIPLKSSFVC